MRRRDMKRLFELLAEVVDDAPGHGPDPETLALLQAARRLAPDLDWLLARRLLDEGAAVVPPRPVGARALPALSALSLAGHKD